MIDFSVIAKVIIMLSVTLIAMGFFVFLLKKFKKITPMSNSGLQVITGAHLGHKSKIVLVEAQNTQILIGVTDTSIQTLHVFKDEFNSTGFKRHA